MFFFFTEISGLKRNISGSGSSNRFETYQASGTHLLKFFIFLVTLNSSNMNSPYSVNFIAKIEDRMMVNYSRHVCSSSCGRSCP